MSRRDPSTRPARDQRASSRPAAEPRAEYRLAIALGIAGVLVAAMLVRLHARAHAGFTSFCSLSEAIDCDRVALSAYSVQLGVPLAMWGMLGYAAITGVAAAGLKRRGVESSWPAALLLVLTAIAAAASVGFALVSKFAIGAWCLLCVVSWAISLGLLVTAWRACRRVGARDAFRSALSAAARSPLRAAGVLFSLVAVIAMTVAAYPRYWEHPRAGAVAPLQRPMPKNDAQKAAVSTDADPLLIVEYTDYECPFCARMHEEMRRVARRPDVRVVRRHFPLDAACNPAVGRGIHPTACALARAAICAEAQGLLVEMEDALFANQREKLPVDAMAVRAGLDLRRFEACMSSSETGRRLADDIAAAVRDGVRATPSYVVGGTVHAGRFPVELLRPLGSVQDG